MTKPCTCGHTKTYRAPSGEHVRIICAGCHVERGIERAKEKTHD